MAAGVEGVELPGSRRDPLWGFKDLGPALPEESISVSLYVRTPPAADDRGVMTAVSSSLPREHRYLSRTQLARAFGALAADIAVVRAFARREGLKVSLADRARRLVQVSGRSSDVAAAFGVELRRYAGPGASYRGRSGVITVPSDIAAVTVGIVGLDNRTQARPHFRVLRPGAAGAVSYSPLQVGEAYAFPNGTTGAGQTVGLLELGGGYSPKDLSTYFQGLGVPAPTVTAVGVDGATNAPTGDPNGPDAEVELDIEMVGSLAPGAHIVVYFAPNTDQGFLDGLTAAVHDTTNHPDILSISWGSPESGWTAQARSALNAACADAARTGMTVLAASGDQGADDGDPTGTPAVDFPASSPYVVGCGGTRLTLSGTQIQSEVVWNELNQNEGATGGGVSEVFPIPPFQASARVPPAPNGFLGRGVPDVAGDADPTTGYAVFVDGQPAVIGGTSAVAPLWAALIARINQALGMPVGYVEAALYGGTGPGSFHDVTSGNNGVYSAGPGWDACTGLGSPDGAKLLSILRGPSASTPPRRVSG
ncbi:MAG: S53 family peptidase [Thermoplasmata archaeon]